MHKKPGAYKEPNTITILRRQLAYDAFGAELALNVLRLAIEDMQLMVKAKKHQICIIRNWGVNKNFLVSVEERQQLTQNYARGLQTFLWMHEPRGRFEFWCSHLGFDPEYVKDLIKKELKYYANKKRERRNKNNTKLSG